MVSLSLGHKYALDGIAFFEIYLYPMFSINGLKALTKSSGVGHYHVYVVTFVVFSCNVTIGFLLLLLYVYLF